ncbi:class I SAM-dependent methyltransferase [Candidatus Nomurabacteria bacterium]|nr:class I SAM-dependent methyltransferase [Candidatus Nomurabacteria bacterium]
MDKTQRFQEEEYSFPYHHAVEIEPFSQTKYVWWGYRYAHRIEMTLAELSKRTWNSLVDIGCGDGKLTYEITKRFPNRRVVGTDYSERSLRFAKAFCPEVEFLSQTSEVFDSFVLMEVLEHIPLGEVDSFLHSVSANLKPGGFGIITVPSDNLPLQDKHYQHFSDTTLRTVLEKHFTVERIDYAQTPAPTIARLLANRFFILNYQPLISYLYRQYTRTHMHATSKNGQQLFAVVVKKN